MKKEERKIKGKNSFSGEIEPSVWREPVFHPFAIFDLVGCSFEVATCSPHVAKCATETRSASYNYMHGKFSRTIRSVCVTHDIFIQLIFLSKIQEFSKTDKRNGKFF